MTSSRVFITNLDFALTADTADPSLRDATLAIERERIVGIGPAEKLAAELPPGMDDVVMDGRGWGVVPGFVDTHVHLSETLSRGVFPDNLATRAWVFHWAKPFYAHVNPEDERVSVLLGTAEMLRCGTTCFLDMGAQNDPGITARAAEAVGIRGIVARHAADTPPQELPRGWSQEMVAHHFFPDAATALETLEQCVRDWDGYADGRIRCWVNIEGKEPCSLELHLGARRLAERLGVGTTYHVASSIEEAHVSERRHGCWPISRIAQNDGLGSNLVLAHAVATAETELPLIADAGVSVAFCPSTSLKLAKGATAIGRYPEMRAAGIDVGLGTDGVSAAGNLNLMRQLYLTAGLFKDARMDAEALMAADAFRMATIEGACALGWDDEIGSLEVGKQADFVLFDLSHPEWTPLGDPLQTLVWSASSASVAQTWVAGRCVYADGRVAGVDESDVRAEARVRAAELVKRAGLGAADLPPVTTTLYD